MKKRLLITSIVMMLVVAVALSTATYAWFTSNANVTAKSMTLKASTSDASSLSIGWSGTTSGTTINSEVFDVLNPMAPQALTVGTTTSSVEFDTSTTYIDASVIKFNNNGAAVNPITYHNEGNTISSFYVKNDSPANTVGGIKVTAVFSDYLVALAKDYTFEDDVEYYTKSGTTPTPYTSFTIDPAPSTYSPAANDPQVYAYVPYVKSQDTTPVTGVNYYEKVANGTYAYAPFTTTVTNPKSQNLYEKIGDADDMIRVAIFTRVYRQAGNTYAQNTTYYAYNTSTGILEEKTGITDQGTFDAAGQLYVLENNVTDYKLNVVLAKDKTTGVSAADENFDLNEVYFTKNGDGYSQDTTVTAANWDSKKATAYTCTYTAVCGQINKDSAVKDLTYYTGVVNNAVIAENLQPGEQIEIVAKAWLDGTLLNDKRASQIGTVSLQFDAVA